MEDLCSATIVAGGKPHSLKFTQVLKFDLFIQIKNKKFQMHLFEL